MDKHILSILLNTSWQWCLLVGITWFVAHRLRRSHSICHTLWFTTLLALPMLLIFNSVVPGVSFRHAPKTPTARDMHRTQPTHIDIGQLPIGE